VHLVKRVDEVLPLVLEPPIASETPSMPPPAAPPDEGDGVRL
jgi:hypothetical protein